MLSLCTNIRYDKRNGKKVLHMLRHAQRDTKNWTGNNGAHQFSLDDGLTWHLFGGHDAYPCHGE